MNLKIKILLGFVIILTLFIIQSFIIINMNSKRDDISNQALLIFHKNTEITNSRLDVRLLEVDLLDRILNRDILFDDHQAWNRKYAIGINMHMSQWYDSFTGAHDYVDMNPLLKQIIVDMKPVIDDIYTGLIEIKKIPVSDVHTRMKIYKEKIKPLVNKFEELGSDFVSQNSLIYAANNRSIQAYSKDMEINQTITIATALLLIIFTFLYAEYVLQPIGWLMEGVLLVTKENLSYRVRKRSNDELGQLTNQFNRMTAEIKNHRDNLINQIRLQEKYRLLFEGSKDVIFSLDENWNFLTANSALKEQLHIMPDQVVSRNFFELIYSNNNDENVTRMLLKEKLQSFSAEKGTINFKTQFMLPFTKEPKDMNVSLQYFNMQGKDEILGKLSGVQEDVLIKYLEFEKQRFHIGNYMYIAEDISYRITRNLSKFIGATEITVLRFALREIIMNAIEHGNLNITFEEKSKAMAENRFFELLAERQNDPVYSKRKVEIEYKIDQQKFMVRLADEGDGFDFRKVLDKASNEQDQVLSMHGRGISMAQNIFDIIQYNQPGNQVVLIKLFNNIT